MRDHRKQLEEMVNALLGKDHNQAYRIFQQLEQWSREDSEVYFFFDRFAEMMEAENSYVRNRGLLLIAANARWDEDNKIDEIIDEYVRHITDVKPITARQCVKALPEIARYKPDLEDVILKALTYADVSRYADSMRPLVEKDIQAAVLEIQKIQEGRTKDVK